jgi:hypothetical protein
MILPHFYNSTVSFAAYDCQIVLVNNVRLDCHQSVLAANSPVLATNLQSPLVVRDSESNKILIKVIDRFETPPPDEMNTTIRTRSL